MDKIKEFLSIFTFSQTWMVLAIWSAVIFVIDSVVDFGPDFYASWALGFVCFLVWLIMNAKGKKK